MEELYSFNAESSYLKTGKVYLFISPFVSFRSVFSSYSWYEFCTFLVKFIPMCLIFFTAVVNGVLATFRVDPSYSSAEDIAAINALLNVVKEGAEFEFTGLVIAYSQSDVTPQILIVNENGLNFGEISDEENSEFQSLKKSLEGVKLRPTTLGDYVKHNELFKAYPELKNLKVTIRSDMPRGYYGSYNSQRKEIILNSLQTLMGRQTNY